MSPERRTSLVGWAGNATRGSSRTTTTASSATTVAPSARSKASRPTESCTSAPRARRSGPACASAGSSCRPSCARRWPNNGVATRRLPTRPKRRSPSSCRWRSGPPRAAGPCHLPGAPRPPSRGAAPRDRRPDVRGVSAGLHLTLALPAGIDELSVVRRALDDHRLALWGLRQHYQGSDAVDGLVLGFSRTATDFDDSVARLAFALCDDRRDDSTSTTSPRAAQPSA